MIKTYKRSPGNFGEILIIPNEEFGFFRDSMRGRNSERWGEREISGEERKRIQIWAREHRHGRRKINQRERIKE